jgi:asparagine synthase (glutamine-hydrolysing)
MFRRSIDDTHDLRARKMRTTLAVLDKKGDEALNTAFGVIQSLVSKPNECSSVAAPNILVFEEGASHPRNKLRSPVAIASISESGQRNQIQLIKLDDSAFAFEGRVYSPKTRITIAERIAKKSKQERQKAIESMLRKAEGDFYLVIAEPNRILAARDPIGVQPFYYGENDIYAAFGSNRKVMWKFGIKETKSFPPGHIAIASREGFKFTPIRTLIYTETKPITMEDAASSLQKLLERSVHLRVRDTKEVAVAFSGGLDSSVVAFLAKKCGASVHLVHVSLENQAETELAKRAAEELKLPLSVHLFQEEDVMKVAAEVVKIIEDPDPVKLAIGIPFYWTAQKTFEVRLKVLLAGQGADELFGGYQRYVNEYRLHGERAAKQTMFEDATRIYESNLERDKKICIFHNVEMRLPFATYPIAMFATSLPINLMIEAKTNSLRKLVLRKVAENLGIPTGIVKKPKKAIQYTTGINKALKKLAKKEKIPLDKYVNLLFMG